MTPAGTLRSIAPPAAVMVALLALMEIAKAAGWLPITVPAPSQVVAVIPAQWDNLVYHAGGTLRSALLGYFAAACAALALASLALSREGAERPILSLGVLIDCVPLIALAPIFVIWIGQGSALYITIAGISSFFPLLLGTVQGFKATDRSTRELFHVMAANRWQRLRLLAVPSSLPYLFAAMKVAAPLALLGTLIAEWMGAERGLGAMILYALFSFNVPVVWLTIVTICGLSAGAYGLIALLEARIVNWGPKGVSGHG
ncbi:ABC transporter permease [Roseisalinus antarcticus]|uniref:Putative aliphatic sulfonates transport permease protein SsuC n=1 Tax=Roseisalinus antarcticus TaxID=254357 RepID=A0A1Y5SJQ5_9RHOB|nr:ABC transporter permease [Roseisalinus antarcticus]SLN42271.1 Putative aliphatic sulfonates transport permease protein SsuC [Roseisalinus antarcticus]